MRVINKYKATGEELRKAIYIGRPSPLGNPFRISDTLTREECISKFEIYAREQLKDQSSKFSIAFSKLKEDDLLACYCAPKACHGDIIKKLYEERYFGEKEMKMPTIQNPEPQVLDLVSRDNDLNQHHTTMPLSLSSILLPLECGDNYAHWLNKSIIHRDPAVENSIRDLTVEKLEPYQELCRTLNISDRYHVLKAVLEELQRDPSNYGDRVRHFKHKHSHDVIDYDPLCDGVTHINVYSKAKTELGRLLSNFAHTPFKHPRYGHFSSVEAFWYWLSTGKKNDQLRSLHGYQSKKAGLLIRKQMEESGEAFQEVPNFKAEIKKAILCKIEQNEHLRDLLKNSSLPLTHYYIWGNVSSESEYKVTYPVKYAWIHEYIDLVRQYLNGEAHKVLIAGSRDITSYDEVKEAFENSKFKAVEFVSGLAKGVDSLCVRLAKELEIPCELFPADWENYGNSAGYIRNKKMAEYATAAITLWNGTSRGTRQMIDILQKYDMPHIGLIIRRDDAVSS